MSRDGNAAVSLSVRAAPASAFPARLHCRVPAVGQIHAALSGTAFAFDAPLYRAVTSERFIGTASPMMAHRFGPPAPLMGADGLLPWTWLYLANDERAASWESQFVKNHVGAGSGFFLTERALSRGRMGRIRFRRPLWLFDLTHEHSSRLGVHDIITSSDHEACQWLGYYLREAMLARHGSRLPDGLICPSRRVPGVQVIVLADWAVAGLFADADISMTSFAGSKSHAAFLRDPMYREPPERDASPLCR